MPKIGQKVPKVKRRLTDKERGQRLQEFFDMIEPADDWIKPKGASPKNAGLHVVRLSDVADEDLEWLWEQRVPLNALTVFCGDPDVGKSWCVLDLCARITRGDRMPDGSPNPFGGKPRDVLWFTADERASTIKRRFRIVGGDTRRMAVVTMLVSKKNERLAFSLDRDLSWLRSFLDANKRTAVVVFDPLGAFVGNVNTHQYSDVYQMLAPVNDLAEQCEVTVLPIMHLNKGEGNYAKYRVNGSVAISSGPRAVWLVQDDSDDKDRRLLLEIKNNDRDVEQAGFAFRLQKPNGLKWEKGTVNITANQSLVRDDDGRAPAVAAARASLELFLRERGGRVPACDAEGWAKSEGICKRTLATAKSQLGVKSVKTGGKGAPWCWKLPEPKGTNGRTPEILHPLHSLHSFKGGQKKTAHLKKSKNAKGVKSVRIRGVGR